MKKFDLNSMGVHEMNTLEMKETDGGIIWLIVAAVAVVCSGCQLGTIVRIESPIDNQTSGSSSNGFTTDLALPAIGTKAVSVNPNQ